MARAETALQRTDRLAAEGVTLDPTAVTTSYPWLLERNRPCILSTDADGLLCGLMFSHYLDWKIVGYYDTKVLVCDAEHAPSECVFLDVEIYRQGVASAGQHMLRLNNRQLPPTWANFDNCFAINNYRNLDASQSFKYKYPFGTIHFLLSAVHDQLDCELPAERSASMLFADGTLKNIFGYPENAVDWMRYLRMDLPDNPLHPIFFGEKQHIEGAARKLMEFFAERDAISYHNGDFLERGDRITITERGGDGSAFNLIADQERRLSLDPHAKERAERFLRLLSHDTRWEYDPDKWKWSNWALQEFTKSQLGTGGALRLNNRNYNALLADNPLSWAITAGDRLEYTRGEID